MGAVPFDALAFGTTADEAFTHAVEDAKHMHGHNGYTGTVAEKTSFTVIPEHEHTDREKQTVARDLIDEEDQRIQRKRGPAGAINCSGTKAAQRYREQHGLEGEHGDVWLFFGWAAH